MVSIYRYQNRPARKFFHRSKTTCKKMFCPTKKNTCSNDYPITLAGQFLMTYGKVPVSLGADDIFKHHAWAGEGNAEENCRMDELNIRKGKE